MASKTGERKKRKTNNKAKGKPSVIKAVSQLFSLMVC
jgi:hypothetical protein